MTAAPAAIVMYAVKRGANQCPDLVAVGGLVDDSGCVRDGVRVGAGRLVNDLQLLLDDVLICACVPVGVYGRGGVFE